MKYKPKFSNVKALYNDVAKDLKEAVALEDRAVSRFAEILDEWVKAIIFEALEESTLITGAIPGAKPEDVIVRLHCMALDSIFYEERCFDLWALLDTIHDFDDYYEDGLERKRAIAKRLRAAADSLENDSSEEITDSSTPSHPQQTP